MQILNLTDREVSITDINGVTTVLRPQGTIVQVSIHTKVLGKVNGIDIVTYTYSEVSGLPEPKKDTMYLVSWAVLQALNNTRPDVIAPDTSPTSVVKGKGTDGAWKVIGVKKFRKL